MSFFHKRLNYYDEGLIYLEIINTCNKISEERVNYLVCFCRNFTTRKKGFFAAIFLYNSS